MQKLLYYNIIFKLNYQNDKLILFENLKIVT